MYEFDLTSNMPFAGAIEPVREALMAEPPEIVSDADVQAIFSEMMGKEMPPYRILGACNPGLADQGGRKEAKAMPERVAARLKGQRTDGRFPRRAYNSRENCR